MRILRVLPILFLLLDILVVRGASAAALTKDICPICQKPATPNTPCRGGKRYSEWLARKRAEEQWIAQEAINREREEARRKEEAQQNQKQNEALKQQQTTAQPAESPQPPKPMAAPPPNEQQQSKQVKTTQVHPGQRAKSESREMAMKLGLLLLIIMSVMYGFYWLVD